MSTIQQQIVSKYLNKEVSHEEALSVIENDFGGLVVFIGNLKEFRKAEDKRLNLEKIKTKLDSYYKHSSLNLN